MRCIPGIVALLCLLSPALVRADDQVQKDVLARNAQLIAAALPPGWNVRADGEVIRVEREQEALFNSMAANGPPDEKPQAHKPTLVILVSHSISAKELEEHNTSNKNRDKALELLAGHLRDLQPTMPSSDDLGYRATTPDQQARLDAYKAVYHGLKEYRIPSMFANDIALEWGSDELSAVDAKVTQEMQAVAKRIESLYAKAPTK